MNQQDEEDHVNNLANSNDVIPSSSSLSNLTVLYTLLILTICFIIIEGIEVYSSAKMLIKAATIANTFKAEAYFDQCIKYPLIFKLWYSIYSCFASTSGVSFMVFLMIDSSLLFQKVGLTFLHMNYFMFGPLLSALTITALLLTNKTMIICDETTDTIQFSPGIFVNTIMFLVFSLVITLIFEVYEGVTYIIDSILNKPRTSQIIHYIFWRNINGLQPEVREEESV